MIFIATLSSVLKGLIDIFLELITFIHKKKHWSETLFSDKTKKKYSYVKRIFLFKEKLFPNKRNTNPKINK